MDVDNHARLVSLFADAFNANDLARLAKLLAADVIDYSAPARGRDEVLALFAAFRATFPDAHITTEDIISSGDKVVWRTTTTGTHLGDALGIAPIGRRATWTGIDIFRMREGCIAERWFNVDNLWQFQQLGLLPTT
jgi:predicted ester cyclase